MQNKWYEGKHLDTLLYSEPIGYLKIFECILELWKLDDRGIGYIL